MDSNTKIVAAMTVIALSYSLAAEATEVAGPLSRAEVKADTRAAEKAGKLTPAGEGPEFRVPRTSEKTRGQRKAETLAARQDGTLAGTGLAPDNKVDKALRAQKTTVDRAARKAETRAAQRAGELIPAGEGPIAPRK